MHYILTINVEEIKLNSQCNQKKKITYGEKFFLCSYTFFNSNFGLYWFEFDQMNVFFLSKLT